MFIDTTWPSLEVPDTVIVLAPVTRFRAVVVGMLNVMVGVRLATVSVIVLFTDAYAPEAAWVAVIVVVPAPVTVTSLPLTVATPVLLLP
jgi:hypothetical protein